MTISEPPANPSASWDVSEDVLWAVWNKTYPPFLRAGYRKDPLTFSWMLASPGQAGWDELTGERGFPTSLVAAFALSDLRTVSGVSGLLERVSRIWPASTAPQPPGKLPFSVQGSGHLQAIVKEGEAIVAEKCYIAISGDLRPVATEHGPEWLHEKVDPVGSRRLQEFLESSSSVKS